MGTESRTNLSAIKILIVDDSEQDALLILRALRKSGLDPSYEHVSTVEEMREALKKQPWDIVLSDYNMPGFGARRALDLLREYSADTPFIVVSGAIGEEATVNLIRSGAADYVMKTDLLRLTPIIRRELKDRAERANRQAAEEELRRSKEFANRMIESSQDCIKTLDLSGRLLSMNRGGQVILEVCDFTVLVGKYWPDFWKEPNDRAAAIQAFEEALAGRVGKFAGFCPTMKGKAKWWDVMLTPIRGPDGAPEQVLCVSRDITELRNGAEELKRGEEVLKEALEGARAASDLKSAFLANVSHEIRTPLGAILGFTDLLFDSGLPASEREKYLRTIQRNGKLLARLIDDILDLSKVEAGRMDIEKIEFPLMPLIEDVLDSVEVRARDKKVDLKIERITPVPEKICSDPTRLRQILLNVVGNAIKFTDVGNVRVIVSENAGFIDISVEDSGIGISAEQCAKLFQYFTQADGSMTRKYGGSGVGLALSKRLAQKLGGDLELKKSAPGKGSTFSIRFQADMHRFTNDGYMPTLKSRKPGVTSGEAIGSMADSVAGTKVLLVEDSPDNQLLIGRILTKAKIEVDFAPDGSVGVTKALSGKCDVVVMDVQMPVMDGLQAVKTLRQNGFTTPVIALTAHAMSGDREKCLREGFDGYLTKPVDRIGLLAAIEKFRGKNGAGEFQEPALALDGDFADTGRS